MKQNATRILSALLGISIVILTANGAAAASVSELQSELDVLSEQNSAIQAEIDAIQRQYDDNYTEMSEIVQRKADIDQQIGLLKTKIENTNAQISVYKQLIADSQEELDAAQEELTALSQAHRERIRAMEEGGTVTYWQVLFQANSFTDLLDRLNMVQEISEADRISAHRRGHCNGHAAESGRGKDRAGRGGSPNGSGRASVGGKADGIR